MGAWRVEFYWRPDGECVTCGEKDSHCVAYFALEDSFPPFVFPSFHLFPFSFFPAVFPSSVFHFSQSQIPPSFLPVFQLASRWSYLFSLCLPSCLMSSFLPVLFPSPSSLDPLFIPPSSLPVFQLASRSTCGGTHSCVMRTCAGWRWLKSWAEPTSASPARRRYWAGARSPYPVSTEGQRSNMLEMHQPVRIHACQGI